ncbi:MAG: hypothetical protein V2B18_03605 [Pseudomonadota bacterium]
MQEIPFVLQNVVLRLAWPVPVCLFLLFMGLVLRRRPGLSLCFVIAGAGWLFVTALPVTGLKLTAALETMAGGYASPAALTARGVRHVVVLSGGYRQGDLTRPIIWGCPY